MHECSRVLHGLKGIAKCREGNSRSSSSDHLSMAKAVNLIVSQLRRKCREWLDRCTARSSVLLCPAKAFTTDSTASNLSQLTAFSASNHTPATLISNPSLRARTRRLVGHAEFGTLHE